MIKEAAEETHKEVAALVQKLVTDFYKKYGGDYGEIKAEANLLYVQAYLKYEDWWHTKFSSWVAIVVWKGLLQEFIRKPTRERRRQCRVVFGGIDPDLLPATERTSFDSREFLRTLSKDARILARSVLEPPREIAAVLNKRPNAIRVKLMDYFMDKGWSAMRFLEAFYVIQGNL